MKLISLYIENFGKFSNFKYDFDDSYNVFFQNNQWGKTTLSVFIKAMLFGLNTTSSTDINKNDRKKYYPWNNLRCGGNLIIEVNDKQYRIERVFAKKAKDDECKVYDLSTNKISSEYDENIGEQLFGVNADSFERSVFIPQKELEGLFNADISNKLSDLIGGSNDNSSFTKAAKKLDEKIKEIKKQGNKGLLAIEKEKLSSLEEEIESIKENINSVSIIEGKIKETDEKIENVKKEKEDISKDLNSYYKIIAKQEQRKTVEKYNQDIKDLTEKVNEYEKFINNYSKETQKQVKDAIIEKENLLNKKALMDPKGLDTDKYSKFIENGSLDNEYLSNMKNRCVEKDKNKVFYVFRYYVIPIILVALMATLIILTFAVDSFKESNIGLILSSICLIGMVTSTRDYNKNGKKDEEYLATLKKYGFSKFDLVSVNELLSLNNSYNEAIKDNENNKSKQQEIINKISELDGKIADYLNKFDYSGDNLLDKIDYIQQTYWLYEKEKETLENNIVRKNNYIKETGFDENEAIEEISDESIKIKMQDVDNRLDLLTKEKVSLISKKEYLINEADTLDLKEKQKEEVLENINDLSYKLKVLTTTYDILKKSQENLQTKYLKPMKDGLEKYLSKLDKNKEFAIDIDFNVSFIENGEAKSLSYYSYGYRQLTSLCMRLALIDCLFEKQDPFIILDDPFVNFDDAKINVALDFIKEISKEKQIIYFTCHSSRK